MLTLLIGTDWVKNRNEILDRVAADVRAHKPGRVILVPELISHDYERRLCAAAGDTATLYAEVTSFTRMVRSVSDCAGRGVDPCLDKGGRLVAMASTTRQLHSVLKAYASVETKPEFLTDLVSAVDEFKQCCVGSADLSAAAAQSEGSLAQKLEELALVMDTYDGICRHGKRDPADQMNWLLEQLEDCDYAQERTFYVDGFPDFTRQHMEILEHIILHAPNVMISLNCDKPYSDHLAFERAGETAAHICRFAKEHGIEVNEQYIYPENALLSTIRGKLFRGSTEPDPAYAQCLRVYRAGSVYQECVAAARQIREYASDGGRYRDISIACGNLGGYQNTLTMVFRRFGIPLYISGTENILEKPVINAFLAAVDAALGGFERRDILNYLKSVICPLDNDLCDQLENYAITWGIQGSMWTRQWNMHPKGFNREWSAYDTAYIEKLNKARDQVMAPLVRLQKGFRDANDLSGQIRAIYRFMEDISLVDTFEKLADLADSLGDHRNGQIFSQLWEILLGALEQLHDVLGTTVWDADTFARLLKLLLSQYDIGTIPPVLDAVMAGPVSAMRCQECKLLMVLGAEEGCFPTYTGSAGVLSEQERKSLRDLKIPLQHNALDGLKGEFSDIYGVFCGAREKISISAGSGQPSFVFRRLADMCGGAEQIIDTPAFYVGDATDAGALLARNDDEDTAQELELLPDYQQLKRSADHTFGSIAPENIRGIYGDCLRLSPTSINKQSNCRLAFFLKYGLKAKELKTITVDPAEFGTYVHDVLENTGKAVMDKGGFHQVSLDETLGVAKEFSDKYIQENFAQIESERQSFILRRSQEELRMVVEEFWKELNASRFEPAAFELSFDRNAQMKPISVQGATIAAELTGKVDRVDAWKENGQNYFRIVDYKTGKEALDYCDILIGIGLQMLLYLFTLEDIGEDVLGKSPIPVGVSYFPARVNVLSLKKTPTDEQAEKERNGAWERSSLLLADDEILHAICDEEFEKFGVKINKDGSLGGNIASREQFRQLKAFLHKTLVRIVDEIAAGCVDPNPVFRGSDRNACRYCEYKTVCHPDENAQFRNFANTSFSLFWEKIDKEVKGRG